MNVELNYVNVFKYPSYLSLLDFYLSLATYDFC